MVLAVLACAPSEARASCGDYVVVGGKPMASHGDHPTPAANEQKQPSPDAPKPSRTPCQGPTCQRGNDPLPAPPPPAPPEFEQWGSYAVPLRSPPSLPRPFCGDHSQLHRPPLADEIYHPPRALSFRSC